MPDRPSVAGALDFRLAPLVVRNRCDLVGKEAKKTFTEIRVEFRLFREMPKARGPVAFLSSLGLRGPDVGLAASDGLRDLEPLGEEMDERPIDVVDALSVFLKHVRHIRLVDAVPRSCQTRSPSTF
jgi:hypothetical protein